MAQASNILRQSFAVICVCAKSKSRAAASRIVHFVQSIQGSFCIKCRKSTFFIDAFGNMWYYIVNVSGCAYVFIVYTAISWSVYTASDRMPPVHAKLRTAYIEMDCGPG